MALRESVVNKILIFAVIIFGMASRFGTLAVVFMFSTALEAKEGWMGFLQDLLAFTLLVLGFIGIQLLIALVPLISLPPKKFFSLIFSFPHILVVPLVTPFTFGLACSSSCTCHCCSCCGCDQPQLVLSRPLSLVNHIVTLLLMVPPVIFFDFISSWDLGAAQLVIAVTGLLAAPLLLFQPGRIRSLGVLCPDNVQVQFLAEVEGGGCCFRLGEVLCEEPLEDDVPEEGNEAEVLNLVTLNSVH